MSERPSDITLPEGWTWDRVEEQRAKWGIADNMVPVATAAGAVAWGTINSARLDQYPQRAADGNSYRYHATGLPAGGDAIDHDGDMFDGDEPEREEIDHQTARWDHQRDLRKHGDA